MAAKRARKKFTNGWEYFEVLLQHNGFVFRVLLKYFRPEDGGSGFSDGNYKYSDSELQLLKSAADITNEQARLVDLEMADYLKTHYLAKAV
jgi:hypothetical protein